MAKTAPKPPASMSSALFGVQPQAGYPTPAAPAAPAPKPKKKAPGKSGTALARNKG